MMQYLAPKRQTLLLYYEPFEGQVEDTFARLQHRKNGMDVSKGRLRRIDEYREGKKVARYPYSERPWAVECS